MKKLSGLILALAENALAQPSEKTSREGIAAALLLAQVAWNRVVDPIGGDLAGHYRKGLKELEQENPKFLDELKSRDFETLIHELMQLKAARHPTDDRFIHVCGLTAENNVRVEWRDQELHRKN